MTNYLSILKKVYVHPLLWLVIFLAIITGHFIEISMLLCIIFIHEMGHGVAAHVFHWRVKRIGLLPFGGVVEMDEYGNRPIKEELIVVMAGPFQHVWLIVVAYLLHVVNLIPIYYYETFVFYNGMILLFNLLPICPLDGGKLIHLMLTRRYSYLTSSQYSIISSLLFLLGLHVFVLLTVPFHIHLWIVLSFLYLSLYLEWKQRKFHYMKFLLERYYGKKETFQKLKPLKVEGEWPIMKVLEHFYRGYKHPIIIFENGRETGELDENEVLHAFFAEHRTDVLTKDLLLHY
ncbi:stage IV sporulation protein FB [Bacillus coahuilensis m2-6]|uniref:M50 family metallopeptidase n=1 Tax=Bacillus coahuilensis TaxID=408580 RepID=UPI0007503D69|nr:M50 family metallopeptidase [Bacillus coahuilensis]KUP06959.1 stage IV sporulation protein FB [Bacillus coahuilensis m2-6]